MLNLCFYSKKFIVFIEHGHFDFFIPSALRSIYLFSGQTEEESGVSSDVR
jgi:hypothetical protein